MLKNDEYLHGHCKNAGTAMTSNPQKCLEVNFNGQSISDMEGLFSYPPQNSSLLLKRIDIFYLQISMKYMGLLPFGNLACQTGENPLFYLD